MKKESFLFQKVSRWALKLCRKKIKSETRPNKPHRQRCCSTSLYDTKVDFSTKKSSFWDGKCKMMSWDQTVHSGWDIKGEGDKTVTTDRNEWNFGIFFEILSEW